MNKIYRNLLAVFLLVTAVLFTSLTVRMIGNDYIIETKYLYDIVDQAVLNIEKAEDAYNNKLNLMEKVWEERAENAVNVIFHEKDGLEPETLKSIGTMISAKGVHILDGDGIVRFSTDTAMTGNTIESEEQGIAGLLEGQTGEEYYMHVEDGGFWEDPTYCHLVMKTGDARYPLICIEADTRQMGLKSQRMIIENTLIEASTESGTSVAAIGADSGVILGITKNNRQSINVAGAETPQELLAYLESVADKHYVTERINGALNILAVTRKEGFFAIAFTRMDELWEKVFGQWLYTLVALLIGTMAVVFTIRYNFRKYLLNYFDEMESKLNRILTGDYSVTLVEGENKDINQLIRVIKKLKTGYIHKSERMDKILGALGSNIAVFEYVTEMDYYFFSDKIKDILNMSDEEWEQAQKNKSQLVAMIRDLNDQKDENGIILYRGRYLEVQVYLIKQDQVGIILDRTDEVTHRYRLESELKESEKKLGVDDLTKVLNRGGFEAQVKKYLSGSDAGGTLIAFDLDNFKKINDTLGHPEGDKVLKLFAAGLRKTFRSRDIIGRLGGDEFFVFMTEEATREQVERKIQRVLPALNENFGEYNTKFGVSASAGVAQVASGMKYEEVYKMADEALYKAKKAGKDCYSIYG